MRQSPPSQSRSTRRGGVDSQPVRPAFYGVRRPACRRQARRRFAFRPSRLHPPTHCGITFAFAAALLVYPNEGKAPPVHPEYSEGRRASRVVMTPSLSARDSRAPPAALPPPLFASARLPALAFMSQPPYGVRRPACRSQARRRFRVPNGPPERRLAFHLPRATRHPPVSPLTN